MFFFPTPCEMTLLFVKVFFDFPLPPSPRENLLPRKIKLRPNLPWRREVVGGPAISSRHGSTSWKMRMCSRTLRKATWPHQQWFEMRNLHSQAEGNNFLREFDSSSSLVHRWNRQRGGVILIRRLFGDARQDEGRVTEAIIGEQTKLLMEFWRGIVNQLLFWKYRFAQSF